MIKRLIFDVDGTLIRGVNFKWYVKETLKDFNIYTEENILKIMYAFEHYENYYNSYNEKDYLDFLSQNLGMVLHQEFLRLLFSKLKYAVPPYCEKLVETVSYLFNKYELVLLTNYFEESQRNRLKKLGINQFFKECYGEKIIKPNIESYFFACGNHLPSECIMIGDNFAFDVKMPLSLGLHAIWITEEDKLENIVKVKRVEELKSIL